MFEAIFRSKLQYLIPNQQISVNDELHKTAECLKDSITQGKFNNLRMHVQPTPTLSIRMASYF